MKEEGWKLGEALLWWGRHLGHRVWAQARVGTQAEQAMDTALVNTKGPWRTHTHTFARKDLKLIQTHPRPLSTPPTQTYSSLLLKESFERKSWDQRQHLLHCWLSLSSRAYWVVLAGGKRWVLSKRRWVLSKGAGVYVVFSVFMCVFIDASKVITYLHLKAVIFPIGFTLALNSSQV